jgi:hypothetical protein
VKRLIFVIPIMILVYSIAMWMLNKDYAMIDMQIQTLIAAGASVFSGVITFFLMRGDAENIIDAHRERQEFKQTNQ